MIRNFSVSLFCCRHQCLSAFLNWSCYICVTENKYDKFFSFCVKNVQNPIRLLKIAASTSIGGTFALIYSSTKTFFSIVYTNLMICFVFLYCCICLFFICVLQPILSIWCVSLKNQITHILHVCLFSSPRYKKFLHKFKSYLELSDRCQKQANSAWIMSTFCELSESFSSRWYQFS